MEIRDPIHGFIELSEDEARVVNHPYFQRLRNIHQLAMAYLVYPGATHTRFEHSLGVCHIASRLADRLELDSSQKQRVRLAALLHDIGHGPFSHVSESILVACNEGLPVGEVEEFHERIGLSVIRQLHRAGLLMQSLESIENILVPGALGKVPVPHGDDRPPVRNVCRDIVSGPLDADKMDYLLRDSYYAGVQYGVYDLNRLAHAAVTIKEDPNSCLGVREEDIPSVDQFVIANHNMRVQVYGHPIRRVADLMLVRSVLAAIADGNEDVRRIFTYEDTDAFVKHYMEVHDAELIRLVMSGPNGMGKELMVRLHARQLPKEVLTIPLKHIGDVELGESLSTKDTEGQATRGLEERLIKCLGLKHPNFVLVEIRHDRPVRPKQGDKLVDPSAIEVQLEGGGIGSYDQISRFFRHGPFGDLDYLCVWVTLDEPDRDRREMSKNGIRQCIQNVLAVKEEENGQVRS